MIYWAASATTTISLFLSAPLTLYEQYSARLIDANFSWRYQKQKIYRTTIADQEISLWRISALNAHCTAIPGTALSVIEPPKHGKALIIDNLFYPNFPPSDNQAACNSKMVPMKQASYQAAAGFTGHDHLVLEARMPSGFVQRLTVEIDVR